METITLVRAHKKSPRQKQFAEVHLSDECRYDLSAQGIYGGSRKLLRERFRVFLALEKRVKKWKVVKDTDYETLTEKAKIKVSDRKLKAITNIGFRFHAVSSIPYFASLHPHQ